MFARAALFVGLVAVLGLSGCCGWVVRDHPHPARVFVVRGRC
jgi:hypothetical protein